MQVFAIHYAARAPILLEHLDFSDFIGGYFHLAILYEILFQ